jgi:hypothetical protein
MKGKTKIEKGKQDKKERRGKAQQKKEGKNNRIIHIQKREKSCFSPSLFQERRAPFLFYLIAVHAHLA